MKYEAKRELLRLAGRWRKQAKSAAAKEAKLSKTAGWSGDGKGTGDEGWRLMIEAGAEAAALRGAAHELEQRLEKIRARGWA